MTDATTRVLSWAMSWPVVSFVLETDDDLEARGAWCVAVTDAERDRLDIGRQIGLSETAAPLFWFICLLISLSFDPPTAVPLAFAPVGLLSAFAAGRTAVVSDE